MKKSEDTKMHIIEKSARLFNLYGYHGCSLQDIMKETSLKKGGIYNHFSSKDEIAEAAFEYSFKKIQKRFQEALVPCVDSLEKLYAIVDVFGSFYGDPIIEGGCPIFNTAVDAVGVHPILTEKAKSAIQKLRKYVEIKIEECKRAEVMYPIVDAEVFSSVLISTLEGALIMSRVSEDKSPVEFAMKHIKQQIEMNTIKL